jgi:hypothetical protein
VPAAWLRGRLEVVTPSVPRADVLTTLRELVDRIVAHGDDPGFFADEREGQRVNLALMTIEDTEWAIRAYRKPRSRRLPAAEARRRRADDLDWQWPGVGTAYLTKYGLLNAMQLQQLAVETVAAGLGVSVELDKTNVPRLARHHAAAHPFSDYGAREDHFLDRSSIFDNVLKIMSFDPDGEWRGRTEQIPDLKRRQREIIVGALVEIIHLIDTRNAK